MTKKRIIIFTFLSFILVWGIAIPYGLSGGKYESYTMQAIMIYSMLCPTIAVLITRKITKEGFKLIGENSLMLGIDFKNKKWKWYLLAIVLPVLYCELGMGLYYLIFNEAFDISMMDKVGFDRKYLILIPILVIVESIITSFAALGEEIGWRTYLYPKLEELYGNTKAVIIGGIIWGTWHYPLIYMGHNFGTGYKGEPWTGFITFTIFTIAAGSIFYFFTKKTGSVWVAVFLHAINNAAVSSSVLGFAYSESKISGIGTEPTVRMLIMMIPVFVLGIIFGIKSRKL